MGGRRVCLFGVALLATAIGFASWQVNGVLGRSVLLSPALPPNKTVKEIEWSFSAGAGATIQVAEFGPGGFERPDPKDRFKDRLEMLNETALKIEALERGDSGVYGARIKLHPALVEDRFFNLSVSEPLPDPKIQSWLLWKSPAWCHLTLQCHVPSGTGGDGIGPGCWTTVAAMAPGSLHHHAGGSRSPSAAPSPMKRDPVTAQTSVLAFTDALSFALVLPGCPFGPAPRATGTSLAVVCQEPQPIPTAGQSQPQGAALAAARADGNDDLETDPVSFPWLAGTPCHPCRGPSRRHFPARWWGSDGPSGSAWCFPTS
ncbi:uncharacterized protein LOC127026900 [Gymnogyps californianus]|uniref:uncharacterized protein LOC127026900 n=1 Tax=Gymnogyps californianus TaxID=33616 RepID=UPI0021C8DEC4|nr:uncharacterized protein LOC127026900 [Gymnogyps californianus]